MAVVCLYLGARQLRKEQVLKLCKELERSYAFDIPDEFVDMCWQRKPTVGRVFERHGEKQMQVIVFQSAATVRGDAGASEETIAKLEQFGVVEYVDASLAIIEFIPYPTKKKEQLRVVTE
jgi:hypothetical protein